MPTDPHCPDCSGTGTRLYPSTARGKGGQQYSERECETCRGVPQWAIGEAERIMREINSYALDGATEMIARALLAAHQRGFARANELHHLITSSLTEREAAEWLARLHEESGDT